MFFDEKEMKIAEELAWKMLDAWNHAYMPNLSDYAHFYYKGEVILDPWMNEKSQGLEWIDHENEETAVNPVDYYGMETIENYLVNLFALYPEQKPELTEKIKANINEDGLLIRTSLIMPIEVYMAMSVEQAKDERGYECIERELPDSARVYFEMTKLPKELVVVIENGWRKEVIFKKRDANKVFKLLYPNGIKFDYKKKIDRIYGKEIRLIGWGD